MSVEWKPEVGDVSVVGGVKYTITNQYAEDLFGVQMSGDRVGFSAGVTRAVLRSRFGFKPPTVVESGMRELIAVETLELRGRHRCPPGIPITGLYIPQIVRGSSQTLRWY